VSVVLGSDRNIKITKPATWIWRGYSPRKRLPLSEYRSGLGWDTHCIVPGRPLILGGVMIPCEFGHWPATPTPTYSRTPSPMRCSAPRRWEISACTSGFGPAVERRRQLAFLRHARELASARFIALCMWDSPSFWSGPSSRTTGVAIRESLAARWRLKSIASR